MMNGFYLPVYGGGKRVVESIRIKRDIWVKWDRLLWNTFARFRERFVTFFSVFAAKNTNPFLKCFTDINSMPYSLSCHSYVIS